MNKEQNLENKDKALHIGIVSGSLFDENQLNEIIHKICKRIGRIKLNGYLNGKVGYLIWKGIDRPKENGCMVIDYR